MRPGVPASQYSHCCILWDRSQDLCTACRAFAEIQAAAFRCHTGGHYGTAYVFCWAWCRCSFHIHECQEGRHHITGASIICNACPSAQTFLNRYNSILRNLGKNACRRTRRFAQVQAARSSRHSRIGCCGRYCRCGCDCRCRCSRRTSIIDICQECAHYITGMAVIADSRPCSADT